METTTTADAAIILQTTTRRVQQMAVEGRIKIVRRWGRALELSLQSVLNEQKRRNGRKSATNSKRGKGK